MSERKVTFEDAEYLAAIYEELKAFQRQMAMLEMRINTLENKNQGPPSVVNLLVK